MPFGKRTTTKLVYVEHISNITSLGSSSGMSGEEEAVYSGFEEIEEDSRQLQFSFVQSSGTDHVLDVLSEPVSLRNRVTRS